MLTNPLLNKPRKVALDATLETLDQEKHPDSSYTTQNGKMMGKGTEVEEGALNDAVPGRLLGSKLGSEAVVDKKDNPLSVGDRVKSWTGHFGVVDSLHPGNQIHVRFLDGTHSAEDRYGKRVFDPLNAREFEKEAPSPLTELSASLLQGVPTAKMLEIAANREGTHIFVEAVNAQKKGMDLPAFQKYVWNRFRIGDSRFQDYEQGAKFVWDNIPKFLEWSKTSSVKCAACENGDCVSHPGSINALTNSVVTPKAPVEADIADANFFKESENELTHTADAQSESDPQEAQDEEQEQLTQEELARMKQADTKSYGAGTPNGGTPVAPKPSATNPNPAPPMPNAVPPVQSVNKTPQQLSQDAQGAPQEAGNLTQQQLSQVLDALKHSSVREFTRALAAIPIKESPTSLPPRDDMRRHIDQTAQDEVMEGVGNPPPSASTPPPVAPAPAAQPQAQAVPPTATQELLRQTLASADGKKKVAISWDEDDDVQTSKLASTNSLRPEMNIDNGEPVVCGMCGEACEEADCAGCGEHISTHCDASNSVAMCGDCGNYFGNCCCMNEDPSGNRCNACFGKSKTGAGKPATPRGYSLSLLPEGERKEYLRLKSKRDRGWFLRGLEASRWNEYRIRMKKPEVIPDPDPNIETIGGREVIDADADWPDQEYSVDPRVPRGVYTSAKNKESVHHPLEPDYSSLPLSNIPCQYCGGHGENCNFCGEPLAHCECLSGGTCECGRKVVDTYKTAVQTEEGVNLVCPACHGQEVSKLDTDQEDGSLVECLTCGCFFAV